MGAYLLRRLLTNVVVFIVISIAIFSLVHLSPGDPIAMMVPPELLNSGSADFIEQRRRELGLDQPLVVQYFRWAGNALTGDFGYSLVSGRPVSELLLERAGPTLELMGVGMIISILIAFPLGILSAVRRNTWVDYAASLFSLGVVAFPVFFLALVAIYVFTLKFPILPSSGITDPSNPTLANTLLHLVLPAMILGIGNSGRLVRYIRSSMLSELGSDYVRTALAKGASQRRAVMHGLRNSLIPVITILASDLSHLIAGGVVIEQIFAWPGMGQLAVTSVGQNDYSVIIGFALLGAIFVLASNLLADVLYTVADPRVRLS
ncbi:ABC transporter permease [Propionibacteriaceae bacterium Y1700]|uniref:ABC transporter permease n=1 Tax=Microlunatus sp. Y1700 TaxID=3418487 RepID=UPI003DA70814